MERRIRFCLLFLGLSILCTAQQVVSSGGFVRQSQASVDWIIGGSLADIAGFDLNIFASDRLINPNRPAFNLEIFPNPVSDLLNIEITPSDTGRLIIEIFDLQGKVLLSRNPVKDPLSQIDVSVLSEGSYYLKITRIGDEVLYRIEKIIKINK